MPDNWQDISSAPRDTVILGWRIGEQKYPVVCGVLYDMRPGCLLDTEKGRFWGCTHWMPFSPPTDKEPS
ncbi:hypothetical protein [Blastomonas sp. AAP25]|uniref:hypothetical protein n=1 Tax=Blastomonas sp. AAP25 TaxID=1523416 RepID=UPI0012E258CF|nr:hypothetical protein [Blastomonas sp. AAP25]